MYYDYYSRRGRTVVARAGGRMMTARVLTTLRSVTLVAAGDPAEKNSFSARRALARARARWPRIGRPGFLSRVSGRRARAARQGSRALPCAAHRRRPDKDGAKQVFGCRRCAESAARAIESGGEPSVRRDTHAPPSHDCVCVPPRPRVHLIPATRMILL